MPGCPDKRIILFMDRKGMLLTHAVPRGQTVNSEYYSKVINIIITFEINEVASMDELNLTIPPFLLNVQL
jgi:hypothetical protein